MRLLSMLFLSIIGGILLVLSIFYLINSIQQYGSWKWATFILVASALFTAVCVAKLPYWQKNSASQTDISKSKVNQESSTSSDHSSAFSNPGGNILNGQNEGQSEETRAKYVLKQLQKNFRKMGTVTYEQKTKTFKITPTDDNTVKAINFLQQDHSKASQMGWNNLTTSITKTSAQISKAIGNGYSLSLVAPNDPNTSLFTSKDGKTTYDFTK